MVVKTSKSLTILIIVLSILIIGLTGYLVYNEFFKKNKTMENYVIFSENI
ncbi:MAG: hypothetical protein GX265_03660 [Mollicutes bacterium]|nr:hypothetical protein [Mollicutes bacterium]